MEGVIGYTTAFAGNFAPKNWAICTGQTMSISSNTALFSILGTTYGGNGTTTFALPDLQGRAVVGAGQGPGLSSYSLGQASGSENTTLSTNQMTAHSHPLSVVLTPMAAITQSVESPANAVYGQGSENLYGSTTDVFLKPFPATVIMTPTGNSTPMPTLAPVLGLNYVICMFGVFPARN